VTGFEPAASTTPTGFLGAGDRRKTSFFAKIIVFLSLFSTFSAYIVCPAKCTWYMNLTGMYQNYVPKNNALGVKESLYLTVLYHIVFKKSSTFLPF
jgi:hypothetical protein